MCAFNRWVTNTSYWAWHEHHRAPQADYRCKRNRTVTFVRETQIGAAGLTT